MGLKKREEEERRWLGWDGGGRPGWDIKLQHSWDESTTKSKNNIKRETQRSERRKVVEIVKDLKYISNLSVTFRYLIYSLLPLRTLCFLSSCKANNKSFRKMCSRLVQFISAVNKAEHYNSKVFNEKFMVQSGKFPAFGSCQVTQSLQNSPSQPKNFQSTDSHHGLILIKASVKISMLNFHRMLQYASLESIRRLRFTSYRKRNKP